MIHFNYKKSPVLSSIPYLVLILGSFIYFNFFAGYILFYQEKSSLFVLSSDYLSKHLHQPGNLLVYAGNFVTSFYYLPQVGSIIISIIICIIVYLISRILNYLTGKSATLIPFLIGGIILYLHSDYRYLIFNSLGLIFQLGIFYLVIKYPKKYTDWLVIILTPFWYFLTGSFAFILILMFLFYLLLGTGKTRWIKILSLLGLNLLFINLSREYLFFQSLKNLLISPFSMSHAGLNPWLFLAVAGFVSILPLVYGIKSPEFIKLKIPAVIPDIIVPLLLISLSIVVVFKNLDENNEQYFHVEKLFYQNKLDELIQYNLVNPSNNRLTSYLNNIALCETGKLNDLLFHFPQSLENNTLVLQWSRISEVLKRGGYFYYTIGMINEAHRWCYEYMVMEGLTPEGLKMLIKTELINGNYSMAGKYVSIMKRSFFYRKEALEYEKLLFNDTAIDEHPELGEKRKSRLKTDFFVATQDPYLNIDNVLAADSLNRKALEYKLSIFLLKKDFLSIVKELPKLESSGFKKMPVHIEEAIAVYEALANGASGLPVSLKISEDTKLHFKQYYQIFQQFGNDRKAAQSALKNQFGDTFWYYVFYY